MSEDKRSRREDREQRAAIFNHRDHRGRGGKGETKRRISNAKLVLETERLVSVASLELGDWDLGLTA